MKKLFAALALCVSAVAFANDKAQASEQQDTTKPMWNATDLRSQKPGSSAKKAEAEAQQKTEAQQKEATGGSGEDNRTLGEKTKDALGLSKKDQARKKAEEDALFKPSAQAFNVSGTVKSASNRGLKLERTGLPEADLKVRDQTVVMLDGKRAKADEIPEGSTVRARFQLDGNDTVAVHIDAKSHKRAPGGAGTESKTKTQETQH